MTSARSPRRLLLPEEVSSYFEEALRPSLERMLRLRGCPPDEVQSLATGIRAQLERESKKQRRVSPQDVWTSAVRHVVAKKRRRPGTRDTLKGLREAEIEVFRREEAAVLQPEDPHYRAQDPVLCEYDRKLVAAWKGSPATSLQKHGQALKLEFSTAYPSSVPATHDETLASKRLVALLRRLHAVPVTIRVHKYLDGERLERGAIVDVREVGESGRTRFFDRVIVPVNFDGSSNHEIKLEPGTYEFSSTLPSGSVVSETVDVREAPVKVELHGGSSPNEWLAWQHWSGNVTGAATIGALRKSLGTPVVAGGPTSEVIAELWRPGPGGVGGLREPLWERLSGMLETLECGRSIPPEQLRTTGRRDTESLPLRQNYPYHYVQLPQDGGQPNGHAWLVVRRGHQAMLCAMPWPWSRLGSGGAAIVEAVIATDEEAIEERVHEGSAALETTWSVRPAVRDATLGGVLSYFATGEQTVARALLNPAREMLREKVTNPIAAAGGAHVLVSGWIQASANKALASVEAPRDWMQWVRNLAAWFQWLPDGAILSGWLALRMRDQEPDVMRARADLLEAERRGLPLYTAGVRKLVDGLMLVSCEMRKRGQKDDEVDAALARARRLAWQVDPRQPFTCVRLWST